MTETPVCVISNGTLFFREDVRSDLYNADRVLPTLCTTNPRTFQEIHRPSQDISLEKVLVGLQKFSESFKGFLEIEIFICPGINDSPEEIANLGAFLSSLKKLDGVFLNSAVRKPVDPSIEQPTELVFERFKTHLKLNVPITTSIDGGKKIVKRDSKRKLDEEEVLSLLMRHPCTTMQLELALGCSRDLVESILKSLQGKGKIQQNSDGIWLKSSEN